MINHYKAPERWSEAAVSERKRDLQKEIDRLFALTPNERNKELKQILPSATSEYEPETLKFLVKDSIDKIFRTKYGV